MDCKQLNDFDENGSTWTEWDEKKHRFMQKIWWHRKYSDWYYSLKYGIKNLFKWFKIVWNDRDYDSDYILRVLQFKIKNTRILTEKNKRHVGYQEDVANMLRCEELIQNLLDDKFAERCGYDSERVTLDFIETEDEDLLEMVNGHPNPQSDEDLSSIFKKARELQLTERKELFKILDKHLQSWWD
jgi:hypothetical protein